MSVAVPVRYRPEHADAFRDLVRRLLDEFDQPSTPEIDRDLVDPEGMLDAIWVVPDGDDLIGCSAMKGISSDTVELKRMYLDPAFRGRGLGFMLIEAGLTWAKEQGFHRVVLDTTRSMVDARRLYESVGFRPTANAGRDERCELTYELMLEPGV